MIAKLRINPHFLRERLRPGHPGLRGAYIGEAVRCRKRWMGELHEGQVRTNKTSAPTTHSNATTPSASGPGPPHPLVVRVGRSRRDGYGFEGRLPGEG